MNIQEVKNEHDHTCGRCGADCTSYVQGLPKPNEPVIRYYTCTKCLINSMVKHITFMSDRNVIRFGCPQHNISRTRFVDAKYGGIELTVSGSKMVNINDVLQPKAKVTKTGGSIISVAAQSSDHLLNVSNSMEYPMIVSIDDLKRQLEILIMHTLEELYDEIDSRTGEGVESNG